MVRIITDSTSEVSQEQAREWNIDVVPLTVLFGEEGALDGVEISNAEVYARLARAETLPTTAQVPPETFIELFQRYVDAGDEVVGLFISSEMSGTCQSALIARDVVGPEHVFVLDSRTVTCSASQAAASMRAAVLRSCTAAAHSASNSAAGGSVRMRCASRCTGLGKGRW